MLGYVSYQNEMNPIKICTVLCPQVYEKYRCLLSDFFLVFEVKFSIYMYLNRLVFVMVSGKRMCLVNGLED